jgi:xanthine dehydrogenase YagR molybdenum-binding subunit
VDGKLMCAAKPGATLTYAEALRVLQIVGLETVYHTDFNDRKIPFSMQTFGAHFAEVRIDPEIGELKLTRFVTTVSAGRIMNMKTALSQVHGGVVMGIGMALSEEVVADKRSGRVMNSNLGEYHVPVNPDVPNIEAFLIHEDDKEVGAIGAKGVGETGIPGVAAAIANAVYNATGKRIRSLPITPDKLLV